MAKKKAAKKKTRFDAKRKGAGKLKAVKKTAARKPGPRSVPLPGMERVRNVRLDQICEAIGEERERMNAAKTEERGLITGALQEMQRANLSVFRHGGVELSRVPGAEKLRVRLTKEEGDAGAEDLETGGPVEDDEPQRPEAAFGEDGE